MANSTSVLARLQRRRALRLTAQRRVIAQVLEGEHIHFSAEEILKRARAQLPELSLATVYNTLNELVAQGELQRVEPGGGGPTLYDPNTERRHHHLVCVRCGELHDVFPRGEKTLRLPKSQRFGYRLVSQEIRFQGYCPRCAGADIPRRSRSSAGGARATFPGGGLGGGFKGRSPSIGPLRSSSPGPGTVTTTPSSRTAERATRALPPPHRRQS